MDAAHTTVAIIDDDPDSRRELENLLQSDPGIRVVAETGLAGVAELEERKPDVILLDIKRPFTDCLEATESIIGKFDETRVIVLSVDLNSNPPRQRSIRSVSASWCRTGACFPICQGCRAEDLLAAIKNGS